MMCDTLSWDIRDVSSLGGGLLSWFGLVVTVGVGGEHPDEGVAVVDVEEPFDFDDADPSANETGPDLNESAAEAEVP